MTTLNFWPEDFREIASLMKNGKVAEAKEVQRRITESIETILCGGMLKHTFKFNFIRFNMTI